jgi:hypothetical protein
MRVLLIKITAQKECVATHVSRHNYRAMTQKIAPEVDDLLEARYQGELWIIKRVEDFEKPI